MVFVDKHIAGGNIKEGHWLANSTWNGQSVNALEPDMIFNSSASYSIPPLEIATWLQLWGSPLPHLSTLT